jgi:hypothetical protein
VQMVLVGLMLGLRRMPFALPAATIAIHSLVSSSADQYVSIIDDRGPLECLTVIL